MPDVFDDIIDRQGSPADAARIAAVIASDFRFAYFCTAAFAVRLLRQSKAHRWHPDESPAHGERAQHQGRIVAGFCHLAKPDDETVTLYADGTAVEIPNF